MLTELVPMDLSSVLGPLAPHHLSEIVVGMILVALIWFIMHKFVSPKFEEAYTQRAEQIEGGIMRAEKAQAEAEAARMQYQNQLAEAREEAAKLREEAKNQGAQILAQMREQATKESQRLTEQAHAQIENERGYVVNELKSEIGGLALVLAERIIGESLTDDERASRTIDKFLTDLEAQPTRTAPDYPELS